MTQPSFIQSKLDKAINPIIVLPFSGLMFGICYLISELLLFVSLVDLFL